MSAATTPALRRSQGGQYLSESFRSLSLQNDPVDSVCDKAVATVTTVVEEPTPDEVWTSGDFTLISSDNVLFRVDSCYLQAASDTNKRIEFTDGDYEKAIVLRMFISLIVDGVIPENPEDKVVSKREAKLPPKVTFNICKLTQFMIKYACAAHLNFLVQWTTLSINKSTVCVEAFFVGALLDEDVLAAAAVAHDNAQWAESKLKDPYSSYLGRPGEPVLHPSSVPYWVYSFTPPMYLWALGAAWTMEPESRSRRSDAFFKLLHSAKARR